MDWIAEAEKYQRMMQAELKIWRERHPREAAAVSEEARAKIEGREPRYAPPQAYGART